MKLMTFKKNQQIFSPSDQNFRGMKSVNPGLIASAVLAGLLVSGKSLAEPSSLSVAQYSTEVKYIGRTDLNDVESPILGQVDFLHQRNRYWISDGIELLSFVSAHSQPMPKPGTEDKGDYRPDECNKGHKCGVGTTESPKLSEEDTHSGEIFLFSLIAATLFNFCGGLYFSKVISPRLLEKSRRWRRYHSILAARWYRNHNWDEPYKTPRKTLCQWLWF